MELKDCALLRGLMEAHGVSARQLAAAAGWKSHTYLQRLLRGEVKTLGPVPAALIAHRLEVPLRLLFVSKASANRAQAVSKERRAA